MIIGETKPNASAFYILQINAFQDEIAKQQISSTEISLWYALMHFNNRSRWTEWFDASLSALSEHSGLCKRSVASTRDKLVERGLIEMKQGVSATAKTFYRIVPLFENTENESFDLETTNTENHVRFNSAIATNAIAGNAIATNAIATDAIVNNAAIAGDAIVNPQTIAGDAIHLIHNTNIEYSTASAEHKKEEKTESANVQKRNTKRKTKDEDPLFVSFWESYPRIKRKQRKDVYKAWQKISPDEELAQIIIRSVKAHAETEEWKEAGGRYATNMIKFLNGERWTDEIVTSSVKTDDYYDEY